jgi:predicted nucleic acid-binding protein
MIFASNLLQNIPVLLPGKSRQFTVSGNDWPWNHSSGKIREVPPMSVQALSEFFSVTTRKLSPSLTPAEALQQITLFLRLWPVFDLTPMIVMEAGRGVRDYKLSYYDAQVWATARLNQVPVVFTENFRDGSILEGVRFVNPFSSEFLLDKWF